MARLYVGEIFNLKTSLEEFRNELIPSFDRVLESWINRIREPSYADPKHFLEVTYLTQPLRLFLERVASNLESVGVFGGPLERGFGFGKTHSLILLWHLFTSDIWSELDVDIGRKLIQETLILGFDFSKERPLSRLISLLETYADTRHPIVSVKDHKLIQAITQVVRRYGKSRLYTLSSDELAELIVEVLEKYSELGGRPRLLLLIDELGYGLSQRTRRFIEYHVAGERRRADEIYNEANSTVNFLSYLYEKLQGKPYSSVIIWVIAEQDRRELKALQLKYQDDETLFSKIEGLLNDLDNIAERYSRGLGGTAFAELSYSPEHAIEIALHRVLSPQIEKLEDVRNAYISYLKLVAGQLNIGEIIEKHWIELSKYYPLSLGMIRLLRKIMNSRDMPRTEYVRTVLYIVAEAAENALIKDAIGSYTIGLKHLNLPDVVQAKLAGELEDDWIQAVSDVEMALSKLEDKYRTSAEATAKYIFGKGVTANILALFESEDAKDVERYGSTLEEIQVEIIQSYKESEAFKYLEVLERALEMLRAESARIDEKEVQTRRYYLPSFLKTIYSKLTAYIDEERKKVEQEKIIPLYMQEKGTVPSLFTNVKVVVDGRYEDVTVYLLRFNNLWDTSTFVCNQAFLKAQKEGKLLIVLVPVWDLDLYTKLYKGETGYDEVVEGLSNRLQAAVDAGDIKRPLHIVVLVPNLSTHRLDKLIEKLVVFEGTKRFLDYLDKSSDILMERLREYEDSFIKRKTLMDIINSEMKEKHLARVRSKLEKEIIDARRLSQKQLINLSREIVKEILSLYHKAIYYSLDENKFTSKQVIVSSSDIQEVRGELQENEVPRSLEGYTSMLNAFLKSVILRLSYQYKPIILMKAVLDHYKREFKGGVVRDRDNLDDVLENLLQGVYGIKPLSLSTAMEALKYLHKQNIEYDSFSVEIKVDLGQRKIKFETTRKEESAAVEQESPVTAARQKVKPIEIGTSIAPSAKMEIVPSLKRATVPSVNLELPPGFNVDDIQQKLTVFIEHHEMPVREITFRMETDEVALTYTIKRVDLNSIRNSRVILNLLTRLTERESKNVFMTITLEEPVNENLIKEVFEDYYTLRRSFDRFLP